MKFHQENLQISISSYDMQGQLFRSPTRLHYSPRVTLWNQSSAEYALREFGENYWKTARWTKCCHLQTILCQQESGCDNDRVIGTSRLLHCHLLHFAHTAERDCTWHDGDRLEGPQYAEGPQAGQVAHFHADGGVPWGDDDEVEPVPGVPQVRVLVKNEALGDRLDYHLCRVDCEEYVPETAWPNWNCANVWMPGFETRPNSNGDCKTQTDRRGETVRLCHESQCESRHFKSGTSFPLLVLAVLHRWLHGFYYSLCR